ncbi:hypothetical protein RFI_26735 [Reticulomyxa filosa]|uniref:Uncharacterized protein n=1 Tax=Reticulomyxa filosa TaxID=46433 RepID=X6MAZ4_RETFI|nr:hypothetical protein RFI_26735 [Reticulomyxa filosa]|eukprot:ETO10642.1 hypothetical protein RFI_26735 [Reticulomyxa filosa]
MGTSYKFESVSWGTMHCQNIFSIVFTFCNTYKQTYITMDDNSNDDKLHVQINLNIVGFELKCVTMPNHRQYAVVWWTYNSLCELPFGSELTLKVLGHYKNALRDVLASYVNMHKTPRLIFKMNEDPDGMALQYKQKLVQIHQQVVKQTVLQHNNVEDERSLDLVPTKEQEQICNDIYHQLLEQQEWRTMNNLTPEERRALKSLREQKQIERQQQTAHVSNQLLMTDPLYAQSYAEQSSIPSDTSTSSSYTLSFDKQQVVLSSPTLKQDFIVTNKMDLKIDKYDKHF